MERRTDDNNHHPNSRVTERELIWLGVWWVIGVPLCGVVLGVVACIIMVHHK